MASPRQINHEKKDFDNLKTLSQHRVKRFKCLCSAANNKVDN
jgi:hypothetical protein